MDIADWEDNDQVKILPHNLRTDLPFSLNDLNNDKKQSDIVFLVLSKLKEWIEFPDKLLQDPSISFEPLLLSIQGAGDW